MWRVAREAERLRLSLRFGVLVPLGGGFLVALVLQSPEPDSFGCIGKPISSEPVHRRYPDGNFCKHYR